MKSNLYNRLRWELKNSDLLRIANELSIDIEDIPLNTGIKRRLTDKIMSNASSFEIIKAIYSQGIK